MPFLPINGKELFTTSVHGGTQSGVNKGVTFLCIHGLGSAHSFFSPLAPELAASGYDFVAYDTYGSGQSKFNGGEQNVRSMSADVEALMQELKLEGSRTILIGHSMGGMVACDVASRLHLLGVVLLGPVHPTPAMAGIFTQRIENVMKSRALIMAQDPKGYASLCKVIADAEVPDYSAVTCPLLIIAGADDKTSPLHSSEMILQSSGTPTSQKEMEVLDGVGHWHCIEAGDTIGPRIVRFAKSIDGH